MKESGVDLVFDQWRGFAAPKGTPKMVTDKMSPIVKKAVESKEWADFTASVGTTPQYSIPWPSPGLWVRRIRLQKRLWLLPGSQNSPLLRKEKAPL